MPRDIELLLKDMLHACDRLLDYTHGISLDELAGQPRTMDAILWNLTMLGEAAKSVPAAFRAEHVDVEWRRAARLRDFVVHVYFGIKWRMMLRAVNEDIPRLKEQVEKLIEQLRSD